MRTTPRKKFAHSLSPERALKGRLNELQRQAIIQEHLNGVKHSVLASRFRCHRNTITNTLKRWKQQHNFLSRPTPGRKPKLTPRERRLLFRYLRQDPTRRWGDLFLWCERVLHKKCSKTTLRRALWAMKLGHWRALKRIYLSKQALLERGRFWRRWRNKENELGDVCPSSPRDGI